MATPPDRSSSGPDDINDLTSDSSSQDAADSDSSTHQSSTELRPPTLRSANESQFTSPISTSSTHLGLVNNARRPILPNSYSSMRASQIASSSSLPESVEAKMRAFHLSRQGTPTRPAASSSSSPASPNYMELSLGVSPVNLQLPAGRRPQPQNIVSAPAIPRMPVKTGLSARRGLKLPGGLPDQGDPAMGLNLNNIPGQGQQSFSKFQNFSQYVDTQTGTLKFDGKAVIHGQGVEFTSGTNFSISLDEVDTLEELGKGNYGTVFKVRHARPRIRIPGLGLAGNKSLSRSPMTPASDRDESAQVGGSTTGVIMAMKEIRLELEESKFAAIIMELDILHRCTSPYIIDFYGAFFQEGAVYICIEYMDGGSIDKIYGDGIPENVLRKITYATVRGLKTLKDDHNIIHRDVKPTNILVNTRGQVKICDFGVSGNLVASIAKTNIGCQSYMAPERISQSGNGSTTYSVQSDIWSMGISIVECALGKYPYPPEMYSNIFSQLSAIVEGKPPTLPENTYSPLACDFVHGCLQKNPSLRPTYSMLLEHGWLSSLSSEKRSTEDVNSEASKPDSKGILDEEVAEWVIKALEDKRKRKLAVTTPSDPKPPSVTSPG